MKGAFFPTLGSLHCWEKSKIFKNKSKLLFFYQRNVTLIPVVMLKVTGSYIYIFFIIFFLRFAVQPEDEGVAALPQTPSPFPVALWGFTLFPAGGHLITPPDLRRKYPGPQQSVPPRLSQQHLREQGCCVRLEDEQC